MSIPIRLRLSDDEGNGVDYLPASMNCSRIYAALHEWWRYKRPLEWTEEQHMDNPYVNVVGPGEKLLVDCLMEVVEAQKKATEENQEEVS